MVRHEPGTARVSPDEPIAIDEGSVTMSCSADPPGWPTPQYRWWKAGAEANILSVGAELTIPVARHGSAGTYFCQVYFFLAPPPLSLAVVVTSGGQSRRQRLDHTCCGRPSRFFFGCLWCRCLISMSSRFGCSRPTNWAPAWPRRPTCAFSCRRVSTCSCRRRCRRKPATPTTTSRAALR